MKRWIVRIVICLLLSCVTGSCASLAGCCAPGQTAFEEQLFWTGAQVQTRPSLDSPAILIEVGAGDSTVLLSNEGFSRGRKSTAHASHHAVFMTLPDALVEGDVYRVSREDDTLHYDGSAGYGWWYMHPEHPARAVVIIKKVRTDRIDADVRIELVAVRGSSTLPIERNGKMTFHRTVIDPP